MKYMAIVAAMFAVTCAGCASAVGSENCQTNMAMLGCGDVSVDAQSNPDGSISPDAGNNNEVAGNETGDTTPNPDADAATSDACETGDPCAPYAYLEGTKWRCGGDFVPCTAYLGADACECVVNMFSDFFGDDKHFASQITFTPPPPEEAQEVTLQYKYGPDKCVRDPDYR
jgi:hypothetical protein